MSDTLFHLHAYLLLVFHILLSMGKEGWEQLEKSSGTLEP